MNNIYITILLLLVTSSCTTQVAFVPESQTPITFQEVSDKYREIHEARWPKFVRVDDENEDGQDFIVEVEVCEIEDDSSIYENLHKTIGKMPRSERIKALATQLGALYSWRENPDYSFRDAPSELRFSCARGVIGREKNWRELLGTDSEEVKAIAAKVLWEHESKRSAKKIVAIINEVDEKNPIWQSLREKVKYSLMPNAIIGAIQRNRDWGLWLAAIRPHKSLVPLLLKEFKRSPDRYAVYALGASKDARVFDVLVKELNSGSYMRSGYGAQALGNLGLQKAEKHLIKALPDLRSWAQAKACTALGKVGTSEAIKHLEQPKKDSAINVTGSAMNAIEQIKRREKEKSNTQ